MLKQNPRPVNQQAKYYIKVYCDQISTATICIGSSFMQGNLSQEETKLQLENVCNKVQDIIKMINEA